MLIGPGGFDGGGYAVTSGDVEDAPIAADRGDPDGQDDQKKAKCELEQLMEAGADEAAGVAASVIKPLADVTGWEYGGQLYRDANGNGRAGTISTNEDPEMVVVRSDIRPGETVVGEIHNHPVSGIAYPSRTDVGAAANLINSSGVSVYDYSIYVMGELDGASVVAEYDAVNLLKHDPENGWFLDEDKYGPRHPNSQELRDAKGVEGCDNE